MSPEEQRICIAEACGWGKPYEEGVSYRPMANAPDYLNDLNAMHEAEKAIRLEHRDIYLNWLGRITEKGRMAPINWTNTTSTAAQRAEAFLRCLGKWKD